MADLSDHRSRSLSAFAIEHLMAKGPLFCWATDTSGRPVWASGAWVAFMGDDDRVEAASWIETHVHPDDRERVIASVSAGLAERRLFRDTYRMRRADGAWRWMVSQAEPYVDDRGEFAGFAGTTVDVTEVRTEQERSRELEDELHHRQRLEGLGRMAGAIAHDFNNLLATVVGNVDLLAGSVGGDADAAEAVQRIEEATARATAITRQMLALSGAGQMTSERVDVGALLEELAPTLKALAPATARFSLEVKPGLIVTGDPESLRHAVTQLVLNAYEAARDRAGPVELRVGRVWLDAEHLGRIATASGREPGTYVSIEVCDHGEGMSAETLASAFDPFFSTRDFGRGLGLSAVQGIVNAHAGAIEIDSLPGAGTCVRLWLPMAEARPAVKPATAEAATHSRARLLVVDDEAAGRALACSALASEGFDITPAADGDDALAAWDANRGAFDVVVTDVTMPGTGGLALVRALRERGAKVPVVMMSGYDSANAARDADVVAVIEKPFRIAQLVAAVRTAAARSR